ncbi:tetratricopeptide repeat protein [Streptomyces sp. NPDC058409]|uniref:tetratricopeptide repeat protein n=1 Tax=Streptomyces sp. NPDC058409 TaxID=3346484 RepID=UPI003656D774
MSIMASARDVLRNLTTFLGDTQNEDGEPGAAGVFREMSEIFSAVQSAATDGRGNAVVHAEKALAEARRTRIAEHPDVLTAQIHLASVCLMFGDVERASTLIREAIPICERVFTEKGPATVEARALMKLLEFDGDADQMRPIVMGFLADAELPLLLQQQMEDVFGRLDDLKAKLSRSGLPDDGPVAD